MSAVATETICFGETSISWTSLRRHVADLGGGAEEDVALELQLEVGQRARPAGERRTSTRSSTNVPSALSGALAWRDDVLLFLVGGEVDDLVR